MANILELMRNALLRHPDKLRFFASDILCDMRYLESAKAGEQYLWILRSSGTILLEWWGTNGVGAVNRLKCIQESYAPESLVFCLIRMGKDVQLEEMTANEAIGRFQVGSLPMPIVLSPPF